MSDLSLQIRKTIFEKFNDPDTRFTNDDVFAVLQKSGMVDNSMIIDDMEPHFAELCDAGAMRNIAQNFTTQWFKLFDSMEQVKCNSCNTETYLTKSEERICPSCKKPI